MNLNFSKYSMCVLMTALGSGHVACAMEEADQTNSSSLVRTDTIEPGMLRRTDTTAPSMLRQTKRVTIKRKQGEEDAVSDTKLTGMVRTRSQSKNEDTKEDTVVRIQRLPSTGSQGDSQRIHNLDYNSQEIKATRERYKTTLTADKPDSDTEDNTGTNARKRRKNGHKVSFKNRVSVRACPNVLEENDSQGQGVLKRTHSYHDYVARRAPAEQQKREQKRIINEQMEQQKWLMVAEIKDHPIYSVKFRRSISKIISGFKKLTSHKDNPLLTVVLRDFAIWQQKNLSLTQIFTDLQKTFQTSNDISVAMDQEYVIHTSTLNNQRNAIIAAHLFDTAQRSTTDDADSDAASTVIDDDINSDTASVTSTDSLYYESMTEMEYFDSLVARYGEALTTLKNDLLRLQDKPASKAKGKRTTSNS